MKKYLFMALAALATTMMSCGGGNEFKVKGNIEGAGDSVTVVLETASSGHWLFVDSVKVDNDGDFSVASAAPEVPGIYRLRYNNQSIYFPIDSIDNIEIATKLSTYATDYTVSGSDNAVAVMNIDKKAMEFAKSGDEAGKTAWKKELAKQFLADPSGMVAYYSINKYIGDKPLFDALNDDDFRIIGAVANAFHSFRPNDPRTKYLVSVLLAGQRARRAARNITPTTQIVAQEIPILEIELQDNKGKMQKLSDVAKQGKVVILDFTAYTADFSPVYNKAIADVYNKYAAQGLEVYQVSLDTDEFQWRQAAKNLPWITVLDPMSVQSRYVAQYNIYSIPTSFIINRNGEIVVRVEDVTKLASEVAKYI